MVRRSRLGRCIERVKRPVAAAVALFVVAGSLPARGQVVASPRGELPRPVHRYLENGDALYRLDAAELPLALAALRRAPGFASVRFERAIPVRGEGESEPLALEDVLTGFRLLDAAELATLESSGEATTWSDVLQVSWASDGYELTTTFSVEDDEIRVVAPFDPRAPGSRVELQVEDVEVEISMADLEAGTVPESVTASLEQAFGRLHDPERMVGAVAGFAAALGSTLGRPIEEILPDGSKWSCVACAGILAGYGVSLMAVVSACGGPFGVPCLVAFLQLTIAKVAVLGSCGACFEYLEEEIAKKTKKAGKKKKKGTPVDPCPCQGQPTCDCD